MKNLGGYAKAIAALLTSAYLAYLAASQAVIVDGTIVEAAGVVTRAEWERIVGIAVSAAGVVLGIPNAGFVRMKELVLHSGTRVADDGDSEQPQGKGL